MACASLRPAVWRFTRHLRVRSLAILCLVPGAVLAADGPPLLKIARDHRVGLLDPEGRLVVPPRYEGCARRWTEGHLFAVASLADPFGGTFVDDAGREILPRVLGQYADDVTRTPPAFRNGRALVATRDETWALATPDGLLLACGFGDQDAEAVPRARNGRFGFVDLNGREILPPRFDDARAFFRGLAPALVAGKWGLIDRAGNWVVAPELDEIARGGQAHWLSIRDGRFGMVRQDGSLVHAPAFREIGPWGAKAVAVRADDHWGLLDTATGTLSVAPAYDEIDWIGTHAAWARQDEKWGQIALDGTVLHPFESDEVRWLSPERNLWVARRADREALIGAQGELLLPGVYRSINRMTERYSVVQTDAGAGLFDVDTRRLVIPESYDQIIQWEALAEHGATVRAGSRWGLVRLADGQILIPVENDSLQEWNGLVAARRNERVALFAPDGREVLAWDAEASEIPDPLGGLLNGLGKLVCRGRTGLIDARGAVRLPCRFDDVGIFSEGLVPAAENEKWGFVDLAAAWVVPPKYARAQAFSEGLAAVDIEGRFGFIDPQGELRIPARYADAGYARQGRIPVAEVRDGHLRWGLIDRTGEPVLPTEFEAIEWYDFGPEPTRVHGEATWPEF